MLLDCLIPTPRVYLYAPKYQAKDWCISLAQVVPMAYAGACASAAASSSGREVSCDVGSSPLGRGQDSFVRTCCTEGCQRTITESTHRHCCSLCGSGTHSSRCDRIHFAAQRLAISTCRTPTCGRRAGRGHLFCCSGCKHTDNRHHNSGCAQRQVTLGGLQLAHSMQSGAPSSSARSSFPQVSQLSPGVPATTNGYEHGNGVNGPS